MALLFSNEILNAISEELKKADDSIQIISAFCKSNAIQYLSKYISADVKEKRILIRFRLDDLLSGSTDFEVVDFCRKNGWKVYVRFDLHAKTYIVDNKRGINTSANATLSGLSIGKTGNIELGTLVDIEPQDIEKINKLFQDAIEIDDIILDKLRNQYNNSQKDGGCKNLSYKWSSDILDMFEPDIETLFSYELPDSGEVTTGDFLGFLDMEVKENNLDEIKETFRWSNSYLWLLRTLKNNDGCIYFGALSAELHDAVITDPKPYRKDIKQMLANLLSIIEILHMDEISIDRPNYSQRVKLVEKS